MEQQWAKTSLSGCSTDPTSCCPLHGRTHVWERTSKHNIHLDAQGELGRAGCKISSLLHMHTESTDGKKMSSASVLHPALSRSSTTDKTTAGLRHRPPAAPCPSPRNFPREPAAKALPVARCLQAARRTAPHTAHRTHNTRALQTARAPHAATGAAPRPATARCPPRLTQAVARRMVCGCLRKSRGSTAPPARPAPKDAPSIFPHRPLRSAPAPLRAEPRALPAPAARFSRGFVRSAARGQREEAAEGRGGGGRCTRPACRSPQRDRLSSREAELSERCGRCGPSARARRCRREHRAMTSNGINGHERHATARDIVPCP